MINTCEFILSGFMAGVSGVSHLIGRCGDLPIQRGEVFDQLHNRGESIRPIKLTVTRIEAYQREWEELGPGMTAKIDVVGEGVEWIRPHSVLLASHHNSNGEQQASMAAGLEAHSHA